MRSLTEFYDPNLRARSSGDLSLSTGAQRRTHVPIEEADEEEAEEPWTQEAGCRETEQAVMYHPPVSRWHRRKSSRLPKWSGPLSDTASDSGQWFPTDIETAFAASVRLPRGTALLVDTGSPGNIVGSEWVKDHAAELRQASLPAPRWTQRQRMLTCSGVGVGSQHASHDVEVPIGLGNGRLD